MRFNSLLNNFSAGVWSPKARARSDAQEYMSACEELLNMIPQMQGGAFRRPGTARISLAAGLETDLQNALDSVEWFYSQSIMIPKVLSDGTTQILVAFDTQPSTTWIVYDVGTPANSGALGAVGTNADVAYSSDSLQYSQVGDLVVIVDGNGVYRPRVWTPLTYTTGTLQSVDAEYHADTAIASPNSLPTWKTVPYRPVQALDSSVTLTPGGSSGLTTLTASAAFFSPDHVGAYFKLSDGAVTGVGRVFSYSSSTVVTFQVLSTVAGGIAHGGSANADSSWEESAWSTYRGFPRTVCAYQGRLYYGGNESQPDTIWASRAGNVFDMMERPFEQDSAYTGYTDDNSRPFTLTPNSKEASNIVALSSDKTLIIHTRRSEIVAFGTSGILGPNDFMLQSSSTFGANRVLPIRSDNYSLFVKKGGRKLCEVTFTDDQDKYKATDLTFLADHLTRDDNFSNKTTSVFSSGGVNDDPIVEIVSSSSENNLVFCKTQNGRLLGISLSKEYKMNAWFEVELGGSMDTGYPPLVKSIVTVPSRFDADDYVFMLVARKINGSYKVFLEVLSFANEGVGLSALPEATSSYIYNPYVDSHKTGTNAGSGLTWSGFSDYIGETLQVYGDGNYIGEFTVNGSGNIVTTTAYTYLSAGYQYTSRLKTLPIEIGQQVPGSPQGIIKRVDEAIIKFYLTRGAKYGHSTDKMYTIDFKDPTANMNAQPTLFTGLKRVHMPTDYARECQIIIEQDKPWPCNILGIISSGITYG